MIARLAAATLLVVTGGGVVSAPLPGGDRAEWRRGAAPALLTLPHAGEGWSTLALRVTGSAANRAALAAANPGLRQPLRGVRVRVPWSLLAGGDRVRVARAVFPGDRRVVGGWEHVVRAPWGGEGESWLELAEWFTGDGSRYQALRGANPDLGLFPAVGARILIPDTLLRQEFSGLAVEGPPTATRAPEPPAVAPMTPTPGPTAVARPSPAPPTATAAPAPATGAAFEAVAAQASVLLEYGHDEAIYRLRPGEALYSAVVVRFTGQLHAADVNATALDLAKRSAIGDVTSIPIGYPVRIPYDLLLPEYLPVGHPRRREWEKDREELAAIRRVIRAANLDGIHVILDAGHGGADSGATAGGAWEATYVYDVMGRVRELLRQETKATVWTTVLDPNAPGAPPDIDVLGRSRAQRLLVDPAYDLSDSGTGVHLRWILVNDVLGRLVAQKVDPERVVFVSLHADSLHPAVRGMMVYVPSRKLRPSRLALPSGLPRVREVRSFAGGKLTPAFRARAEALSAQLGETLVKTAGRSGLPVHPYEPVRSSVLRGRSRWVPAVLRYSRVPSSVLIEICNLNNQDDRELLLTWKWREKLAHAIVAGLAEGFAR